MQVIGARLQIILKDPENTSKIFLDLLLREMMEYKLSVKEVVNETKTIIIAGSDTSGSTTAILLLLLAQNPDLQEQVYNEIMAVEPDGDLTMEQCNQLKVLDRVFKETLRLFPPVPLITRAADQPITLSGRTIPQGTHLIASVLTMQRCEKYWGPTANRFDPDRWLPENLPKHPRLMSFGGTPRNCIGIIYANFAVKVTVAKVLRNFRLSTSLKFEDIRLAMSTILKFENEFLVTFTGRRSNL